MYFLKIGRSVLIFAATAFFLVSCKVEPPKPPLLQTLAVLPFNNASNDINAPEILQRATYLALKKSAYETSDIEITNQKLIEAGIRDGGQLPVIDPTKLGKDLGVQGLVYGSVESFGYVNIGYFVQRKVTVELKVVDVATGQTLWERTGNGATRNFTLDSKEAQENLAKGLLDQVVDKVFQSPLENEARIATIDALRTLPGFVFNGFAEDDKSKNKNAREAGTGITKTLLQLKQK